MEMVTVFCAGFCEPESVDPAPPPLPPCCEAPELPEPAPEPVLVDEEPDDPEPEALDPDEDAPEDDEDPGPEDPDPASDPEPEFEAVEDPSDVPLEDEVSPDAAASRESDASSKGSEAGSTRESSAAEPDAPAFESPTCTDAVVIPDSASGLSAKYPADPMTSAREIVASAARAITRGRCADTSPGMPPPPPKEGDCTRSRHALSSEVFLSFTLSSMLNPLAATNRDRPYTRRDQADGSRGAGGERDTDTRIDLPARIHGCDRRRRLAACIGV